MSLRIEKSPTEAIPSQILLVSEAANEISSLFSATLRQEVTLSYPEEMKNIFKKMGVDTNNLKEVKEMILFCKSLTKLLESSEEVIWFDEQFGLEVKELPKEIYQELEMAPLLAITLMEKREDDNHERLVHLIINEDFTFVFSIYEPKKTLLSGNEKLMKFVELFQHFFDNESNGMIFDELQEMKRLVIKDEAKVKCSHPGCVTRNSLPLLHVARTNLTWYEALGGTIIASPEEEKAHNEAKKAFPSTKISSLEKAYKELKLDVLAKKVENVLEFVGNCRETVTVKEAALLFHKRRADSVIHSLYHDYLDSLFPQESTILMSHEVTKNYIQHQNNIGGQDKAYRISISKYIQTLFSSSKL